jgi:hypothetical protein
VRLDEVPPRVGPARDLDGGLVLEDPVEALVRVRLDVPRPTTDELLDVLLRPVPRRGRRHEQAVADHQPDVPDERAVGLVLVEHRDGGVVDVEQETLRRHRAASDDPGDARQCAQAVVVPPVERGVGHRAAQARIDLTHPVDRQVLHQLPVEQIERHREIAPRPIDKPQRRRRDHDAVVLIGTSELLAGVLLDVEPGRLDGQHLGHVVADADLVLAARGTDPLLDGQLDALALPDRGERRPFASPRGAGRPRGRLLPRRPPRWSRSCRSWRPAACPGPALRRAPPRAGSALGRTPPSRPGAVLVRGP